MTVQTITGYTGDENNLDFLLSEKLRYFYPEEEKTETCTVKQTEDNSGQTSQDPEDPS